MNAVNTDELVSTYLSIRAAREQLLRQYEEQDAALKKDLGQLEGALLDICNHLNANSINTAHGTIMRKTNERYYCNDWDNFSVFVRENNLVHLLEKRIHQGNFKLYLEDVNKDDGLPPGVNVMREFAISVRKSSK
jgi:hypothetical protein